MRVPTWMLVVLLVAGSVSAGPPSMRELRPWGGQRGQTIALTVLGDQLKPGAEMISALPGKLEEQPGGNDGQLVYQLEIQPNAAVGVYPIRVRTPGGLSNVLYFSVGDLPETSEVEPNDQVPGMNVSGTSSSAASPSVPSFKLPITINGAATGSDLDVIRFVGKKGERLVVEVEAQRIGSLLDAAVHLLSASGREIVMADDTPGLGTDCRLHVELPDDGDYFAVVHDSKYAGANPGHYRLKVGSFNYAQTVFPLGAERGGEVDLTLLGGTLAEPVHSKVRVEAPAGRNWAYLAAPSPVSQTLLPFRLAVGDAPEQLEAATAAIEDRWFKAAVMNGRIAEPGEVDRFRFPVVSGQNWLFEVDAANLGSPLDAVLTVTGPQGNVLAAADDGNGLDPRLQFSVPGGMEYVVLSVEDLHGRGGLSFGYRLKARPFIADFSLQVVPSGQLGSGAVIGPMAVNIPRGGVNVVQVSAARNGYNGPIQLSIPEELAYLMAEDGLIPAGAQSGTLVLTAAADAPMQALDLEIRGQAGAAAQPITRRAESAGRSSFAMAEAALARVPAAICEAPPAKFAVAERTIKILHGHNRQLKLSIERGPIATEAINVTATGSPPPSLGGTSGTIPKDARELTITLTQNPEIPVTGTFTMQLLANIPVAGRTETVQIPPVQVEILRPFSLELLSPTVTLTAGGKVRIAAIVRREPPFQGTVRIAPAGSLPQHVSLTTLDVPPGESLALLDLSVSDAATEGELDIQIRASTEMEGRKRDKDYAIPDSTVKVRIATKSGQ